FSLLRSLVFAALFLPALWIAFQGWTGMLGSKPVTEALHQAGLWSLRFLGLTLCVTPLRFLFDWPKLIQTRRMLGLAALAYALLHVFLYAMQESFDLWKVASEIALRVYLTIGFACLLGLIILGATSTDAAIRRLGALWGRLHRIIYVLA